MTFQNAIHPTAQIDAKRLKIGIGVTIGANVQIRAECLEIGDFVSIGDGCKAFVPDFVVGDYTRIGDGLLATGTKPLYIGRSVYIRRGVTLDSRGGLRIEDFVGIGEGSQIWTHARWGDPVQGCRFDSEQELCIERDAWLVGRVTVGGTRLIGARALILGESNVVAKVVMPDTTWGGNPAQDMTARFGKQFEDLSAYHKIDRLNAEIERFYEAFPQYRHQLAGVFNPLSRTYVKQRTPAEVAFLKWSLAKFVPEGSA